MNTHDVVEHPDAEIPDLVDFVTNSLALAGHPNPHAWKEGLHPDALMAGTDANVKRFLINRQTRLILAGASENTMDVRYCLVDTGPMKAWMDLYVKEVIPCLVRNNLPRIPN